MRARRKPARRNRLRFSRRRFLVGVGVSIPLCGIVAPQFASAQLQVDEEVAGRPRVPIRLKVNGLTYRLSVEPRWTLLDVLRNQLDLTGTKRVCDRAECGACTVLRNGQPIYACMTLALEAQGYDLETIEGLSKDGRLHPLQEAFVKNDALQCGFCTPGMVLSLKAMLDRNTSPTLDDVKAAISGNICKCGTYTKIFRAALDAAATLRAGR